MSIVPMTGRPAGGHPQEDPDQLARWRLISLEKQLPQPRLLTGIGTPSLVCALLLTLLAIFAFAYLGRNTSSGVPRAVVESQHEFVSELSRSLNRSVNRSRDELGREVVAYRAHPEQAAARLAALTKDQDKWRGVAVFNPDGKTVVNRVGQVFVLPAGLAPERAALPLVDGNDARMLLVEPLADRKLLVAELRLNVRTLRLDPRSRQAVLIAVAGKGRALAQGAPVQAGPQLDPVVEKAVRASGRGRTTTRTGPAVVPARGSGATGPVVPVVTADAVGDHGFAVVSLIYSPMTTAAESREPLVAALALVVAAIVVLLILRAGLVLPVRRLLAHAKAVASGNSPGDPPSTPNAQVNRIASALSALAARPGGGPAGRHSAAGGVPAILMVVAAVVAVLGAAGGILATAKETERDLPAQVVRDSENQAGAVAAALGDSLNGGYDKLLVLGRDQPAASNQQLRRALDDLLDESGRFRSAYVLSADGSVVTSVGREPLRPTGKAPGKGGVVLHDVRGRLPIVYAYQPLADGRSLVAEFDVRYLTRLLQRMQGRVRVLDVDQRDILDSGGYLAFEQVTDAPVRGASTQALTGRTYAQVTEVDGARDLLVAAPVALDGPAAALKWTVVAQRPVTDFALPGNVLRHGALLVVVVAVGIGLLLFSWHYFFQLRPLRNLAREAATLAGGDTSQAISPRWHDDIGAVAVCLEVCRQAATHGEQRLGGAARLRGTDGMPTAIMPRVPDRRRGGRGRRKGV
ncbi:HAMP domain-containing protein [Micromonospora mangrovi]|uniref:HAMP domain-containing protein n=2 Tax=Micromonospora TaxID=1873 RepID=A0AAU7M6E6_9ACTN